MNNLKSIRTHLGQTQQAIADGLGCTQSNIGHYERGQMFPPEMARKLIAICAQQFGLVITFDHVYGDAKLPELPVVEAGAQQGETGATTSEA